MNNNEQMLIKLSKVTKNYQLGKTLIPALKGIDLDIPIKKFVSIIGPSGCGKTTALNLIGCIDRPDEGQLFFEGNNVLEMSDQQITDYRGRSVGFIFQNFNLVPILTVAENIAYPLLLRKSKDINKQAINERVKYIMESIGLMKWAKHKPNELSGGQRQRVAIGRALVIQPKLVIADEPTANLDSETSFTIMELMRKLQQELNTTFIFATHDFRFLDYVDIIYEMDDGKILGEREKSTLNYVHSNQNQEYKGVKND